MSHELVTRRYSQIKTLRRRGIMSPAAGNCEIPECGYLADLAANDYRPRRGAVVYDHCHRHDYIRGIICLTHNGSMAKVDAGVRPDDSHRHGPAYRERAAREHSRLLSYWARCPECAAAGPWEPVQTEREYLREQIIRSIIGIDYASLSDDELRGFNAHVRFLIREGRI